MNEHERVLLNGISCASGPVFAFVRYLGRKHAVKDTLNNGPRGRKDTRAKRSNTDAGRRFPLAFYIIAVLSPLLLLGLVEIALVVGGSGTPQSYYVLDPLGRSYVTNPEVSYRYFSKSNPLVPTPNVSQFPAQKNDDVTRIFCLGESTTRGFPYGRNASFATFLSDRLTRTFPGRQFEVLNPSIDATMSYTVAEIAREVTRHEPDLIVLYLGHNEFQGAMGAGSGGLIAKNRGFAKAYLKLLGLRTFRVLRDAMSAARAPGPGAAGSNPSAPSEQEQTLMEVMAKQGSVPFESPAYRTAVETYRKNLEEIADACRQSDVPLVVCTLVSNLKDQPPFRSEFSPATTPEQAAAWSALYHEAETAFERNDLGSCVEKLAACAAIDSRPARGRYLQGQCALAAGDSVSARVAFEEARDLDALRFRAPTQFNEILRGMTDEKRVFLADVETAFSARSAAGIPGNELLLEHIHPSAAGYSLIAESIASTMARGEIPADLDWSQRVEPDSAAVQEDWAVTEIDEGIAALQVAILKGRWPFTSQPQTPTFVARNLVDRLVMRVQRGQMSLEEAHVERGDSLAARGAFAAASKEYLAAAKSVKSNVQIWIRLGDAYHAASNPVRAEWAWKTGQALSPLEAFDLRLGNLALEEGRAADAAFHLRMASTPPGDLNVGERATAHYLLIRALILLGDPQVIQNEIVRASAAYPMDPRIAELREFANQGQ